LIRSTRQVLIIAPWTVLVIGIVWIFSVRPPADDPEYSKWVVASFLGTAMPWIFSTIPVCLLRALSQGKGDLADCGFADSGR
jgi:hypothetical protein